jgi:hypothetical protein
MTLETPLDEVLKKIGRNVMLFQQLERLLKYLVATGSISGYASEFMSQVEKRAATISKQTMGQLIGQYIEISNPETREVFEEPKDLRQEQFIWVKFGFGDSTYYDIKKKALAKLVDDRNELIHHLLSQFDPNSIESCLQIEKKLDVQRDEIVRQIDNVKMEIAGSQKAAKLLVSFLNSPAGRDALERIETFSKRKFLLRQLTDIAEQTTRPDGWTPIDRAGHLIKQRVSEETASLKEYFGYKSLKAFILETKIFDVYEESTNNGNIRILYRKKTDSELSEA